MDRLPTAIRAGCSPASSTPVPFRSRNHLLEQGLLVAVGLVRSRIVRDFWLL